jgi:hypothetical protein
MWHCAWKQNVSARIYQTSAYFLFIARLQSQRHLKFTDRANHAISEWIKFHHENHGDQMRITTSMRCFVSIKKIDGTDEDNYSLTIHENTIESVMRCAIYNYKHARGVDLNPISRSTSRKKNK